MKILGLSFYYHDASAALLVDGVPVAMAEEERFSRTTHDSGYPKLAIKFVLDQAKVNPADLDYVVFYEKPFVKFERALKTSLSTWPEAPFVFASAIKGAFIDSYLDILNDSLDDEGHEMLVYMLQRDDWISTLFNDNPDVVANRVWFERLREAILNPDDEDTADTAGEATPEPVKEPEAPHPFS